MMVCADESTVKVDSTVLPGLYKSLEITGDAIVDEQEVEGQSKKPKQATGYEDAKVTIELVLLPGPDKTVAEKLEIIRNLFRRPGQEKPEVHEIINEQTAIYGIREVIFKKLSSKGENKREQLTVTLEFWEYSVMEVTATRYTGDSATDSGMGGSSDTSNLNADYQSYLEANRGNPPVSPAQDIDSATQFLDTVAGMPF